jgi:hypothetical protein
MLDSYAEAELAAALQRLVTRKSALGALSCDCTGTAKASLKYFDINYDAAPTAMKTKGLPKRLLKRFKISPRQIGGLHGPVVHRGKSVPPEKISSRNTVTLKPLGFAFVKRL